MKRKIVILSLALWSALAFALPSTDEVEAAVKAGNYAQADSMMQEVVAAKPQSAKAHYFYARILAHEGKFNDAAAQAHAAQGIDPSITFTDAQKFREFEQEVQRAQGLGQPHAQQAYGTAPVQRASAGVPGWVWVLGIAIIGFLILRAVTRRAQMATPVYAAGGQPVYPAGTGGYGMGPGYGVGGMPMGPTAGSGVSTGLAAVGGLAAGMVAEHFLEGRRENERYVDNGGNYPAQGNLDDGGASAAASDLENRPVDFGNDVGGGWDSGGSSSDTFTPDGGSDNGGGW